MDNFSDIKQYIKENPDQVEAILDSERSSIYNSPEIKILLSTYLFNFWKDRPNKSLVYVITFQESHVNNLQLDSVQKNLSTVITETLKRHRIINVDNSFAIVNSREQEISHDLLVDLSKQKAVVFYFGEEGIDVVVRGKIFPRINVFYDESDMVKYSKKYHISELQACLKEYEKFINQPGINEAFFASEQLIKKIQPIGPPNNTLINSPENTLRNNLLVFLNKFTQHDFTKENELNDKRELDLYAEVDLKKYLIEVKWLGQSVNDDETGFTQKVTDVSARKGVIQTLEYIQHLIEKMSYNVHCGYLCVFDARETKNPVNYDNYKFVPKELMPYFTKHFIKLDEVAVERTH